MLACDRAQRVRSAAERHHANATATWGGSAQAFGVIFRREGGTYMGDVAAVPVYTVSMCVANAPGIAEGSTQLRINGQPVRVSGAVEPDASGWATFPVVIAGGAHAQA